MTPDLNTVLKDALRLPPEDQRELAQKLLDGTRVRRTRRGDITKFFGTFDSGDPDSANNDRIDADLAREYADDHEPKP
ncbi:MAG: hypothetical protein IT174_01565 [Acidobacteria bacterium]|nr:hypothetical protein [Acidobacteriota bacterium]